MKNYVKESSFSDDLKLLGYREGKKEIIAKACEWLNKTLYIHTEVNDTHCGADTIDWVTSNYNSVSDFINDFKKEMEGKNG